MDRPKLVIRVLNQNQTFLLLLQVYLLFEPKSPENNDGIQTKYSFERKVVARR